MPPEGTLAGAAGLEPATCRVSTGSEIGAVWSESKSGQSPRRGEVEVDLGGDAFMKLAPVTAWFVRDRPKLKVVETAITVERLGICVRHGNTALRNAINTAQATLAADGTLAGLIKQWLGAGATPPA